MLSPDSTESCREASSEHRLVPAAGESDATKETQHCGGKRVSSAAHSNQVHEPAAKKARFDEANSRTPPSADQTEANEVGRKENHDCLISPTDKSDTLVAADTDQKGSDEKERKRKEKDNRSPPTKKSGGRKVSRTRKGAHGKRSKAGNKESSGDAYCETQPMYPYYPFPPHPFGYAPPNYMQYGNGDADPSLGFPATPPPFHAVVPVYYVPGDPYPTYGSPTWEASDGQSSGTTDGKKQAVSATMTHTPYPQQTSARSSLPEGSRHAYREALNAGLAKKGLSSPPKKREAAKKKNSPMAALCSPPRKRCIVLKNPVPSSGPTDMTEDVELPKFRMLANFPEFIERNRNGAPEEETKNCVMCGKLRIASTSTVRRAAGTGPYSRLLKARDEGRTGCGDDDSGDIIHVIPRQNKGVCTACDVSVWLFNDKLQIKWCKGCKNFRPWISFGEKNAATKCVRCRKRQKEQYAMQKEKMCRRVQASTGESDDDMMDD